MSFVSNKIKESIAVKQSLLENEDLLKQIEKAAEICIKCLQDGGKVLFCGNGGSAADAQHLAAEFSGRFYKDRDPLFAEALHVNTSYLTAVANDYGYEHVYSRLIKAKGVKGDILIDDRSFNLDYFDGRTIMFTSPHNMNSTGHERANNWQEVGELLL